MRTVRSLDINSLYEKGIDSILLDRDWYQRLSSLVHETEWIPDDAGIFLGVPKWSLAARQKIAGSKVEQEAIHNAIVLENAPTDLLRACHEILRDPGIMGIWRESYSAKMTYISLWNGAEDLDWHWDGPAKADFFFLIYLNHHAGWPENGGGELIAGVRNISSGYLKTQGNHITELERIQPASRTLVCCNNQNPRFVHKVLPLREARERTVLMIGFSLVATMRGQSDETNAYFR